MAGNPSPFDLAWERIHAVEKGYSNNPNDPGGETNHGITWRVARAAGYYGPMRDLPVATARAIAKREYWDSIRGDEVAKLSQEIAEELFDIHYNMWRGAAAKFLQRALNGFNRGGSDYSDLNVDGVIGPVTIRTLAAFLAGRAAHGETVMLRALNAQQGVDYLRQAAESVGKEDFLYGWFLNRVKV